MKKTQKLFSNSKIKINFGKKKTLKLWKLAFWDALGCMLGETCWYDFFWEIGKEMSLTYTFVFNENNILKSNATIWYTLDYRCVSRNFAYPISVSEKRQKYKFTAHFVCVSHFNRIAFSIHLCLENNFSISSFAVSYRTV